MHLIGWLKFPHNRIFQRKKFCLATLSEHNLSQRACYAGGPNTGELSRHSPMVIDRSWSLPYFRTRSSEERLVLLWLSILCRKWRITRCIVNSFFRVLKKRCKLQRWQPRVLIKNVVWITGKCPNWSSKTISIFFLYKKF